LRPGTITFNVPGEMKQSEERLITAIITTGEIKSDLVESLSKRGQVYAEDILVSSRMRATLSSNDFDVRLAATDNQRAIIDAVPAQWNWYIKPKRSGNLSLQLSVDAVITVDKVETANTVRVLERQIVVTVDPTDAAWSFISGNWQWLVTGLGAPTVTAIVGWMFGRRAGRDAPADDGVQTRKRTRRR